MVIAITKVMAGMIDISARFRRVRTLSKWLYVRINMRNKVGTVAVPKYSTFDQRTLMDGWVAETSNNAARVHSVKARRRKIKEILPVVKRCHQTNTARIAVVNPVRIKTNW